MMNAYAISNVSTSRPGDNKPAAPPRPPPPSNRISVPTAVPTAPVAPLRPRRSLKPKNRRNVIEWFQQEELVKRICYDGDKILPYFHGKDTKQLEQGHTIVHEVLCSTLQ